MNKKYIAGFVFLFAALVWVALRIGGANLREPEGFSEEAVKNGFGYEASAQQKLKSNSRPKKKKNELSAESRAIYRARGGVPQGFRATCLLN